VVRIPRGNGIVECLHCILLEGHFKAHGRGRFYESLEEMPWFIPEPMTIRERTEVETCTAGVTPDLRRGQNIQTSTHRSTAYVCQLDHS